MNRNIYNLLVKQQKQGHNNIDIEICNHFSAMAVNNIQEDCPCNRNVKKYNGTKASLSSQTQLQSQSWLQSRRQSSLLSCSMPTEQEFVKACDLINSYRLIFDNNQKQADAWFLSLSPAIQLLMIRVYNMLYDTINDTIYSYLGDPIHEQQVIIFDDDTTSDITKNLALYGDIGYQMLQSGIDLHPFTQERYPIFLLWDETDLSIWR